VWAILKDSLLWLQVVGKNEMGMGVVRPVPDMGTGRWQSKQGQVLDQFAESPRGAIPRKASKLLERDAASDLGSQVYSFFFSVLGFELRAYNLSHSPSPFL
jgi:hypothetical protein